MAAYDQGEIRAREAGDILSNVKASLS